MAVRGHVPDRREPPGRRPSDYVGRASPSTFLWALIGGLVVLYLFFAAIGAFDPADAPGWSIAVLVLAILWLGHAWRRLWAGGASPPADRERRGF